MLTLVIVSLVSAGIGAVVMVTLLHCRRSVSPHESPISLPRYSPENVAHEQTFHRSQSISLLDSIYAPLSRICPFERGISNSKYENVNTCARGLGIREIALEIRGEEEEAASQLDTDRRSGRFAKRSRFSLAVLAAGCPIDSLKLPSTRNTSKS